MRRHYYLAMKHGYGFKPIAIRKMKRINNMSAPSEACDLQSVKVRHRKSQASPPARLCGMTARRRTGNRRRYPLATAVWARFIRLETKNDSPRELLLKRVIVFGVKGDQ